MRNLKKILALVLALVMSFSLMATANAFTDDEQITDTYETAVTVLDGLKVFQGYDDGSFQPQSPIRRSEVAAIIYRIVTGDVTDAQVGIYADYNKFNDVKSTSWYAGYVNFCANAEYIKGRDAKTFDPDSYVTGYEALAMILRAIGYDKNGEFTGSSWQVQTAATGELRGITKNITAGTLGTYASREVVAEILFQTILVDKVNYTPAFGYQLDDTSLGWDTFELEDIEGVVIANEYADLYNTKPLKAGKTELDVDGDSYVLAYASELTDIGEARHAYITEGENVLYLADAGNTVFETGAATDIETDKKFESATGLERDDDTTEYFINFDGGAEYKASDWKIKYVLTADTLAKKNAYEAEYGIPMTGNAAPYTYTNTINPGKVISDTDMAIMKDIFYSADLDNGDLVVGAVYVGTQSNVDISDDPDVSWKSFQNKYIDTAENVVDFDESDNGEWLKVIDNDGDGVADYVFLTEFAMSVIERISKDDEYTLADLADDDEVRFDDNTVEIDGADIVTEDELAEDDVVIYTLIDGKYYMNIAEMVTETVDKKGIDKHDETMTCDGTVYTQSHIGYTDETNYYTDVTEAHTEVTYDLYLDHFGFVRLFIESDYNTFMLLTDGYYYDNNRAETYQAYYWNVEADEETQIDVSDNDYAPEFIYSGKSDIVNGDVDVWGRLLGADTTYLGNDDYWPKNGVYATNIAGYTDTGDGYALKDVRDSAMRKSYDVQAINVTANTDLDDESLDARGTAADIQTTTDTQYYLVIRSQDANTVTGWTVDDVITWTGYKNAPAEAELNFEDNNVVVGYAVTRATKTSGNYTVADVVVFETEAYSDRDTYFVYDVNNWNPIEYVYGIGYDDEGAIFDENKLLVEDGAAVIRAHEMIEFYKIYDNERVDFIGDVKGEYAKNYIYAGVTKTGYDVENRNYIRVDVVTNVVGNKYITDDMYISLDAPIYYVDTDSNGAYIVKELSRDKVNPYDKLIVFANKDDEVQYAIDVTVSVDENGDIFDDLYNELMAFSAGEHDGTGLWNRIVYDTVSPNYPAWYEDVKAQAEEALAANTLDKLEAAQAALEELLAHKDKLTVAQVAELGRLSGLVGQAIAVLKDATTDREKATALVAAHEKYVLTAATGPADAAAQAAEALKAVATDYLNDQDAVDEEIEGETALENSVAAALQKALEICDSLTYANTPYAAGDLNNFTAVKEEREDLDNITDADKALFSAHLKSLDEDAAEALQDAYDEKIDTLEGVEALVDLAKEILESYNIFTNAGTTQAQKDAAKDAAYAAAKTILNDKTAYPAVAGKNADEAVWTLMKGSDNTCIDYKAYEWAKELVQKEPQAAKAALKLSDAATWAIDYVDGELIVGNDAYNWFTVDNIGTYLEAADNAVGTIGGWTVKRGDGFNTFTATFEGPYGGEEDTIEVDVRNADDDEKVAHDKAAVTEALEDVNTGKMIPAGGRVSASDIEGFVKTRVENALGNTSTTEKWSGDISVSVLTDVDTDYNPPKDAGATAKWVGTATITITSGTVMDTVELPLTIQVEKKA